MLSKSILHTSKVSLCSTRERPRLVVVTAENLIPNAAARHHALITARLSPVGGKITFRQNRIYAARRRVIIIKMNECIFFPFEAQTAGSFYCVGSIQKNLLWLCVHSKQKAGALNTQQQIKRTRRQSIYCYIILLADWKAACFTSQVADLRCFICFPRLLFVWWLWGINFILCSIAGNDKTRKLDVELSWAAANYLSKKVVKWSATCPLCFTITARSLTFKRYTPRWGNPQLGTTRCGINTHAAEPQASTKFIASQRRL